MTATVFNAPITTQDARFARMASDLPPLCARRARIRTAEDVPKNTLSAMSAKLDMILTEIYALPMQVNYE
jgi:hypothetical protein